MAIEEMLGQLALGDLTYCCWGEGSAGRLLDQAKQLKELEQEERRLRGGIGFVEGPCDLRGNSAGKPLIPVTSINSACPNLQAVGILLIAAVKWGFALNL